MAKKKVWKNKKYPGTYAGYFVRDADGERNFVLKRVVNNPSTKPRRVTFESPEAAKAQGWKAS